ncbi:MAG: GNAT family N-acetyltransferase [Fibrobacter sp.]|nr:GNAT family N-acetyltransferase [Fibrobacter sp.]
MKIEIRKFKKKDVDSIIPIIKQYREHHHKIVVEDSLIASTRDILMSMLEHKDSFVFVAEKDLLVIGYMVIHFCPFPLLGSNEMYITDLVVLPDYRIKGVGKALVDKAIETGRAMKCKRLMVNNNKAAESYIRSFYRKNDFNERTGFANFVYQLD